MTPKLKFAIFVIIIFAAVTLSVIYFLSTEASGPSQNVNLNSVFVEVSDQQCGACSAQIPGIIYSLLARQGYSNSQAQVFFGDKIANGFISNNSITALPSVALPQTEVSANLLYALLYLNIFNLEGNSFVLNTPFVSGLTGRVTYFNIIQNRTITAVDIYNVSNVYKNVKNPDINPMEFIMQYNASNLTRGNKTEMLLVYSYSPFSAIQSLIIKTALDNFGNFSSIATAMSNTINVSSTQRLGPEPLYEFSRMAFSSNLFYLSAYNLSTVLDPAAQRELFEYDQNAASLNGVFGSFTPFLDIGGRYISISSMLSPVLFNGMDINQVNTMLKSNSTASQLFNDSVAFLDAVLCSYAGNTKSVCNTPAVQGQTLNIEKQINLG